MRDPLKPFEIDVADPKNIPAKSDKDLEVIFRFPDSMIGNDHPGMILTSRGDGPSPPMLMICAVMAAATYAQSNECSCRHCTQMMKVCDDFSKLASAVMERAISEETSH